MKIKSKQTFCLCIILILILILVLTNFKDGFSMNNSGNCMDVSNNTLRMNKCNSSLTQQFKSIPIINTNYHQLSVDNSSNICLELINGRAQLRNCMTNMGPGQNSRQKWSMPNSASNTGKQSIQHANTAAWGCLGVNNNNIVMRTCGPEPGQNWSLL